MTDQNNRELFLLILHVRRIGKKNWFQFWRRNHAKVYAHVYGKDAQEAREITEKDMHKKGFEISRQISINKFGAIGYPSEVMKRLETSLKHRNRYTFYGLLKSETEMLEGKEKTNFVRITSRYADYEGVRIDLGKLPGELHDVIPYAKKWAICDDVERAAFIGQIPMKDAQEFYRTVTSKVELIEAYCDHHRKETPVPDEVVLFDLMMEAFSEIAPGIGVEGG
jgi:hypothetical protein